MRSLLLLSLLALAACGAQVGEACHTSEDCAEGLTCAYAQGDVGSCAGSDEADDTGA